MLYPVALIGMEVDDADEEGDVALALLDDSVGDFSFSLTGGLRLVGLVDLRCRRPRCTWLLMELCSLAVLRVNEFEEESLFTNRNGLLDIMDYSSMRLKTWSCCAVELSEAFALLGDDKTSKVESWDGCHRCGDCDPFRDDARGRYMVVSVGCRRCYSKLSNELSNLRDNLMREPYVREIIPGGKWRWGVRGR